MSVSLFVYRPSTGREQLIARYAHYCRAATEADRLNRGALVRVLCWPDASIYFVVESCPALPGKTMGRRNAVKRQREARRLEIRKVIVERRKLFGVHTDPPLPGEEIAV